MTPRGLTEDQAKSLDEAFLAALADDLIEYQRLWAICESNLRPKEPIDNVKRLAPLVAARLQLDEDGVRSRLYGNKIPVTARPRAALMQAVQDTLAEVYEQVQARFVARDYTQSFVTPVQIDATHRRSQNSGDRPSGAQLGTLGRWDDWQHVRIGAWLADADNPSHVDNTHRINLFHRIDLLDYEQGDFYSVRRIRGTNVSPRRSSYLIYRESSERMFSIREAGIRAFDVESERELVVEGELDETLKSHTHAFLIYFPRPIEPGESFDLVYSIRLPGELLDLQRDPEVMSVSLVRFGQGVDNIRFDVVVGFCPTRPRYYFLTDSSEFLPVSDGMAAPVEYVPQEWWEVRLGLDWRDRSPFAISWSGEPPRGRMCIATFRGAKSLGKD